MIPVYSGKSAYCYANSLYMALAALHADPLPDVGIIECLTMMPFGVVYADREPPVFLASGPGIDPDAGVTLALGFMGWGADETYGGDFDAALERLREAMRSGPAMIGPLDMSHLTYIPYHRDLVGVDHYAVVLEVGHDEVLLHDPDGYPFVMLPFADFEAAWRADAVNYGRGPFMLRAHWRQMEAWRIGDMIAEALPTVIHHLRRVADRPHTYSGAAAIHHLIQLLEIDARVLAGELMYFSFPLGARRCTDAARFLALAGRDDLGRLMAKKAQMFGMCQQPLVAGDWDRVLTLLDGLAKIEDELLTAVE